MTRVFLDQDLRGQTTVTIAGHHAHYLLTVLGLQPGERLEVIDGGRRRCEVVVERCARGVLEGRIVACREPEPPPRFELHLYPAVLKGERFDLVIQKCTELGVARIQPVLTARTVARIPQDRLPARVARWRKIALEACRQCGRAWEPELQAPVSWGQALQAWRESGAPGMVPWEALAAQPAGGLRHALHDLGSARRLAVFIGPEGGFTRAEIAQAEEAGLRLVSLGPRILRAETAAIMICAVALYELADFG